MTRKQLKPSGLELAAQLRNVYAVAAEPGVSFEDTLIPRFWTHVSLPLRPLDKIEIFQLNEPSFYAELLVMSKENGMWVDVRPLHYCKIVPTTVDEETFCNQFEVRKKGRHHEVVRIADGIVLQGGFDDKGAAQHWLETQAHIPYIGGAPAV